MAGRLGIDFGTSNTVIAVWDADAQDSRIVSIPGFSRPLPGSADVSLVPSLIHYSSEGQRWIGNQVHERGLYQHSQTFRWMKRFISHRSPAKVRAGNLEISHLQAGGDFLAAVLTSAIAQTAVQEEEIAFSAPVEAYEYYENWLSRVAEQAGIRRFRLIDEASAAALGYGTNIQAGNVYLLFDCGGGTLDISVVRIEEDAGSGRKCRVLGKSGVDLGGATLDQWLYQEVLKQNNRQDFDQSSRRASRQLLTECEKLKELLSERESAQFAFVAEDGVAWNFELSRARFEELLEEKEAFRKIDQSIRRALNAARERGYDEDQIHSAIMVGGTSHIPAIQKAVQRIFGRERTHLQRPLDAVARGAAAFVSGVDFFDHIQHDYAIKYLNPAKGDYDYKILVKKGTAYPTTEPLARLTVKSTFAGQTQMGVAIYEMGQSPKGEPQPFELVFDPSGAARVMEISADEQVKREMFWINETAPTFLPADPPAVKGEARFEVEFSIDPNKRLLISARDLKSGSWVYRNFPMIKLS